MGKPQNVIPAKYKAFTVCDYSDITFYITNLREVQAILTKESQQRVSSIVADDLLDEVLEEQILSTAGQVHQKDVVEKDQRLEDTFWVMQTLRLQRYFRRWKNNHAGKEHVHVLRSHFITHICTCKDVLFYTILHPKVVNS